MSRSPPRNVDIANDSDFAGDDGNAAAGPSKPNNGRPRIAKACQPCGKQKLKCDGSAPCSRCIALACTETCIYLPSLRGKTRKKRADREREAAEKAAAAAALAAEGVNIAQRRQMGGGNDIGDRGAARGDTYGDARSTIPLGGSEWTSEPHRHFWDKSNTLASSGVRNSALWRDKDDAQTLMQLQGQLAEREDDADDRGRRRTGSNTTDRPNLQSRGSETSPSVQRRTPSSVDKLTTTLPLPGDAHNPLAVLVELSEVTPPPENEEIGETSHASEVGGPSASHTVPTGRHASVAGHAKEEDGYYAPLTMTLRDEAPHIMSLINTHEAKQLFENYFAHLHPHLPFLDKAHSSPGMIARRNNFLFNATARSYNVALWERLKDFARFEMERLPKEKNIDVVQGHLIYTCWNLIRPKRFEQDMTWLRAGIASRTAIDIALHRVGLMAAARQGLPAWLLKTIVRTWLLCFVVDRTLCIQLGKPSGRQWEVEASKYVRLLRGETLSGAQEKRDGEEREGEPSVDDLYVAALTDWALTITAAVDAFRSHSLTASLEAYDSRGTSSNLADTYVNQLVKWHEDSAQAINQAALSLDLSGSVASGKTGSVSQLAVYEKYGRLVIQSLALQHAMESVPLQVAPTFAQYQNTAIQLVDTIKQTTTSLGSRAVRGVQDFMHSALTYAATSLLRCTQTHFSSLSPDRARIFEVARQAADLLGESATGVDHTAAVQSGFVSKLIAARDVAHTPLSARMAATKGAAEGLDRGTASPGKPAHGVMPVGTYGGKNLSGIPQAGPSGTVTAGVSPDTMFNRPPEAIDFEAFARALNVDHSMTPWPPLPPNVGSAGSHLGMGMLGMGTGGAGEMSAHDPNVSGNNGSFGADDMWSNWGNGGSIQTDMGGHSGGHTRFGQQGSDGTAGTMESSATRLQEGGIPDNMQNSAGSLGMINQGSNSYNGAGGGVPLGLESWVAQQGLNLSSSGLGPGVGDFIGMGVGDGEGMGFMNEAFWQTVFNGRGAGS